MYVVLRKGKKAQAVREETYGSKPRLYKDYELVKKTDSWKEAQALLRKIKNGDSLEVQNLPAAPVNVRWSVTPNGLAFVYGLYDDSDRLLYIGVTSSPNLRCENHIKNGKKFSYMRVLFRFNSREEADSYERFAIASLNPPINVLVEGIVPGSSHNIDSLVAFGELSDTQPLAKISTYKNARPKTKPNKKKKKKPKQSGTVFCDKCGFAAGKNNRYTTESGTYHSNPCMSPEEKALEKEIIKTRNAKIRSVEKKYRATVDEGPACKFCKKPLSRGRHIPCRRKRLKELGRL